MFTLQILDRGQTFLHPLERGIVLLGNAPPADIVLGEQGVVAAHVRFEVGGDSVQLVALAATRVNGRAVQRCELALGDRIEIGRGVVVVGRAVTRAASPDDVLAGGVSRARARRPARSGRRVLAAAVLGAALLVGGGLWLLRPEVRSADEDLATVARLRATGEVERAQQQIASLRQLWQGALDDRLQRLDQEAAALQAIEAAFAQLRARVLDPTDTRGYAEWSQELTRWEAEAPPEQRVAAAMLRPRLPTLLLDRPRLQLPAVPLTVPPPDPVPVAKAPPDPPPSPAVQPTPAATPPAPSPKGAAETANASVAATAKIDTAEADRLVEQGMFAQAIELLHASLGEQDDEGGVARIRARCAAIRTQARQAMADLLAETDRAAARNVAEGERLLVAARHRFPREREFAALDDQLRTLRALAAPAVKSAARVDDESQRVASMSAVRAQMDRVRDAEQRGAFADAGKELRAAAAAVRDKDPEFAARLDARAEESEQIAAFHALVATAVSGGKAFVVTAADGRDFGLTAIEGAQLVAGEKRLSWNDVAAASVQAVAEQIKASGAAALGTAALLYRQGQNAPAEAWLAKVLRGDASVKEAVDRVIARGRGEPADPRGYVLGKDGFTSARALDLQKQAAQLATRLDTVLKDKNPAARDAFWTEALAAGPDAVPMLLGALQKELRRQVEKLDAGALKKQVERLAAQRAQLDDARRVAKELIFDEQKYFYPYKPPAVSSEKFAEYQRVQQEVDRRVDALRTLWSDEKTKVRVPASLRQDLDRIDWLAKNLGELGAAPAGELAPIDWVRALPAGESVGLHDFCVSLAERVELEEWRRIEAYNGIVGKRLAAPQRELLKITNDYRAMFRHRPLAIVPVICIASQGHAEEMSKLGYFAHQSPTPGRRTPFDRMRLAGYQFGVSENIALVDGAMGAHLAWCHSSGHHRNLLSPSHIEIGIGADGRYWVQNFGSGRVHTDDPAWTEARSAH